MNENLHSFPCKATFGTWASDLQLKSAQATMCLGPSALGRQQGTVTPITLVCCAALPLKL